VKKVLAVIAALIFALIATVLVAGSLMPREHVASSTIVIPASLDTLWHVVRDIERMPTWWDGLDSVSRIDRPGGGEAWRHHAPTGTMDIAVERSDAPGILVTRIIAEPGAPFGGTWTYRLEPMGASTRVTITEAGYINSKVFRFIANTVMGMHGSMDSYLAALARHFGAEEQPEHSVG